MEINIKGLTQEQISEVSKLLQSETDRVRTDYVKQIKVLEQFKPVEKSQAELDLENRMKVLEDREIAIQAKERETQLQSKLQEKGLDTQLYKYLNIGEDADTFLNEFTEVINKQLLNASYKPVDHKGNKDVITKEQFKAMGYNDRVKLMETNPTLYTKLSE